MGGGRKAKRVHGDVPIQMRGLRWRDSNRPCVVSILENPLSSLRHCEDLLPRRLCSKQSSGMPEKALQPECCILCSQLSPFGLRHALRVFSSRSASTRSARLAYSGTTVGLRP
jgi:hypothetical protein